MRSRNWIVGVVMVMSTILSSQALAHHGGSPVLPLHGDEEQTLQGMIVDTAMPPMEKSQGSDDTEDADLPHPLAFFEDGTQTLYLFLPNTPGGDAEVDVARYLNRSVVVTGRTYEGRGMRWITVTSVEPHPLPKPSASAGKTP